MDLETELNKNKGKLMTEYHEWVEFMRMEGYRVAISFDDWYAVWIDSGHWEERKDQFGGYEYLMLPKDGELTVTKKTATVVNKGHYDILQMVNERVPYSNIDAYIAKRYEEEYE